MKLVKQMRINSRILLTIMLFVILLVKIVFELFGHFNLLYLFSFGNENFDTTLEKSLAINNLEVEKTQTKTTSEPTWRDVSILCVVHTCPKNLQTRSKYVQLTWAKLCNKTLFVSDENDNKFPTIKVTSRTGFGEIWAKTRRGMELLYSQYLNKFDWFFKADDDTYVIMDNLRKFLFKKDPKKPEFYSKGSCFLSQQVKIHT